MARVSKRQRMRGYLMLAHGLREFAERSPSIVKYGRKHDWLEFEIAAPTPAHREFSISAHPTEIEFQFGKLWTEQLDPQPDLAFDLLAMCDAIISGRVREVRDLDTKLLYHIYQLRTRGLNKFVRDSEYHLRHFLKEKVRRVSIKRIPPLVTS